MLEIRSVLCPWVQDDWIRKRTCYHDRQMMLLPNRTLVRFNEQYLPRIGDMDQNFGDEGEVTIEVVELWELEKCKCPEGTPPMRKLVPGEKTLRCSECCRPARKPSTD